MDNGLVAGCKVNLGLNTVANPILNFVELWTTLSYHIHFGWSFGGPQASAYLFVVVCSGGSKRIA